MGQVTWRAALVLFWSDALLIALHLATDHTAAFNLDGEGNVPTWWSSAKLLAVGALAVVVYAQEGLLRRPPRFRWMWLGVGALFAALSMDEASSLHERAARTIMEAGYGNTLRRTVLGGDEAKDSFAWVILFSPVAVAVFTFLAVFAWSRRKELKRLLVFGFAGVGCYITAIVLEPLAVYFTPAMQDWTATEMHRYQRLTLVEESLELLGTSFLVILAVQYAQDLRRQGAGTLPGR